jgi:hypothetical protein
LLEPTNMSDRGLRGDENGAARAQRCAAPSQLKVLGVVAAMLSVLGVAANARAESAPTPGVQYERRSTPLAVVGGILIGTAPTLLVAGFFSLNGCSHDFPGFNPERCDGTSRRETLMATGVAMIAIGVPLLVIGAQRVPVARVAVAPWATPESGGLRLQLAM